MIPKTTFRCVTMLALVVGAFASTPALARGDAAAGKEKAIACQACHGADGNSIDPMYPRISGQYADYLERSLREYRSGTRKNVIMAGFATLLTDDDIRDLAAYYSALPGQLDDLSKHIKAD